MNLSVNSWPAAVCFVAVCALAGLAFYLRPDAIVLVLGAAGITGTLAPAAFKAGGRALSAGSGSGDGGAPSPPPGAQP